MFHYKGQVRSFLIRFFSTWTGLSASPLTHSYLFPLIIEAQPGMLHSRNIAKVLQQGFKPSQLTEESPLAVALITKDGELLSTAMEKSNISNGQLEGDSSFSKSTLSKNDLNIYSLVAIREYQTYLKTQAESGGEVKNWHATTIGERRVMVNVIENTDLLLLSVTRMSYPGDIAQIRSQILSETLAAGLQGFKLTGQ